MEFKKSIDIDDPDRIWSIIKDIDRIPEFWHGTSSITKSGDSYIIKFAFGGTGKVRFRIDDERMAVYEEYLKGPIRGYTLNRIIKNNDKYYLESIWNVRLSFIYSILSSRVQRHFESGTENALKRIKNA
ncbi:SRPBCC family protein [Picrophilus oshimae]|nr:hypothetical protein [Picrophilus oshimae]SMD31074.1 hypothetical protein SAMN02745355_0993 [Picrophilus oshimae DSM 9789]